MSNAPRILVDSCVWLDSYLGARSTHDESVAFIRDAHQQQALLFYGASKLESMFYVLQAEAKRMVRVEKGVLDESDAAAACAFAWGCIENIRSCATAVGVDEADIWLASKYRSIGGDFEDNMVLAAAERAQVDYLVTWDKGLLLAPTVRTATPADMRVLFAMEAAPRSRVSRG